MPNPENIYPVMMNPKDYAMFVGSTAIEEFTNLIA